MEQATMLRNDELWARVETLVARYNRFREHFQAFANNAATLANEPDGLSANISLVLHLGENYFEVTFAGRVFRFRFTPRAVAVNDAVDLEGQIVVTEFDRVTKKEGAKFDSISFNGTGRTTLVDRLDNDPINIQTDVGARYLVLHMIYDVIRAGR